MKTDKQLLKEANELLKSCQCVIERKGESTNWAALENQIKEALEEQSEALPQPQITKEDLITQLQTLPYGIEIRTAEAKVESGVIQAHQIQSVGTAIATDKGGKEKVYGIIYFK